MEEDIAAPEFEPENPPQYPPERIRATDLLIGVPIVWVMKLGLGIVLVLWGGIPFVEELYYRGFIYKAPENTLEAPRATSATIIWFAAAHCQQSLNDPIAIPIPAMGPAPIQPTR